MNEFQNFSSFPPEQEATFVVYEQRVADASKKGLTMGAIAAGIIFLLALVIKFGITPNEYDPMKDPSKTEQTQTAPK
ncbi:MAG: hypothetical protein H6709_03180 [Kofleriaceae bacterium]|nr:hypothetical protein [Myxococcales bacterium]MCB9562751.1 hypothetical protein [Kofleriaceae bacterium]MCB9571072.1 hypothetical protein [Kofleriaceae bacterium]